MNIAVAAVRSHLTAPRPSRITAFALGLVGASQLVAGITSAALVVLAPRVVSPLTLISATIFVVIGFFQLFVARDALRGKISDLTGIVIVMGLAFFGAHALGGALETRSLWSLSFSWLLSYIVAAVAYLAATIRITVSAR